MSIENLKTVDPFAEAEDVYREQSHREDHIHIRIQQRNGRKTLTTVQGIPSKFSQKKILHVVKIKFACNGTTVHDGDLGDVIQLQGDQRKHMQAFLTDKKSGLELDPTSIKIHGVESFYSFMIPEPHHKSTAMAPMMTPTTVDKIAGM